MSTTSSRIINGRYTLRGPLGSGSFGVVHEALDAADPSQPLALKILAGQRGEASLRLGEEFRALANLWHPNVARVLDFGVDHDTGEPFYTMELVRGRDFVAAALEANGAALLALVAQALRALAYVHARGIVHADLKPANLLVRDPVDAADTEADDRVKLLDFGLARSSAGVARSAGGTALYMAPELASGAGPSPSSDLYALGALAYHAACGQPPFTGSVEDVIEAHRNRAPRPPRGLRRTVPEALEAVLLRLLAKDPQDRYTSAREVLETLSRFSGIDLPLETPRARATRLLSAPFVGRRAELETLREQADLLVLSRPHAGMVLITGEAGIGKTRLTRELCHQLQIYGVDVFRQACPREGGGALRPIVEPLVRVFSAAPPAARAACAYDVAIVAPRISPGLAPRLASEPAAAAAATATRAAPDASAAPPDAPPVPGAAAADKAGLLARVAALFLEHTRRPTALVIDDLQWADHATLDFIAFLAPRARRSKIILIGMERRTAGAAPPDWCARAAPLTITLGPLSADEVEALARGLSASGEVPERELSRIRDGAGGNPSFAEEFMRFAEESATDGWPAARVPSAGSAALSRIMEARLERLAPAERAVAEALAAFGRPVDVSALRSVVDLPEPARARAQAQAARRPPAPAPSAPCRARRIEEALASLAARHLARPDEEGPGCWSLAHPTFQEVVSRATDARERSRISAAIAAHVQVLAEAGRDHLLEEVALHLRLSGQREPALKYTLSAARRSERLFDHEAAARLYRSALELAGSTQVALKREIEESLAGIAEASGAPEDALSHLAAARRMAGETGETPALLRILAHTGRVYTLRGDHLRALKHLKEGLSLATLPEHAREYASLCRMMAVALLESGKLEMAESYCAKGLAALGEAGAGAGAGLTFTLGQVMARKGRRAEALALWEKATDLAERLDRPQELLRSLLARSEEHLARGEPDSSRALVDRALQLARARRDLPRESAARWQLAEIALHEGDLARAQELADESRAGAERIGYLGLMHGALHVQAAIDRARGDFTSATENLWTTFRGHSKGTDSDEWGQSYRERGIGQLYLDLGDMKKARSFLARALERARRSGEPALLGDCLLSAGALHLREKRLARAEANLREAFSLFDRTGLRLGLLRAGLRLAELALVRGDLRRAESQARRALALAQGAGSRPLAVDARTVLGSALSLSSEPGHHREARDALEAAAADARALGQPELVSRACHALGRLLTGGAAATGVDGPAPAAAGDDDDSRAAREAYRDAVLAVQQVTARLAPDQAAAYTTEPSRSRLLSEWASFRDCPPPAPCAPGADLPKGQSLVDAIARINDGNTDPDALLAILVDASMSLSGAERGAVLLPDAAQPTRRFRAAVARTSGGQPLATPEFVPAYSVIERALEQGRPIHANDTPAGEPLSPTESVVALDLKSALAVPLIHRGQVLGLLYNDSHSVTRTFAPLDLQLLALFAQHAAIALAGARAYQEIESLKSRLLSENLYLREEIRTSVSVSGIAGDSPALSRALAAVERVAPTDSTVLIRGETGTGKELFARAIHARSRRADQALIKVNVAALPADLIESELFGHEKGAFTGATSRRAGRFELASGGTIFLDEIGDLPPALQVKLLRVLQEREFERLGGTQTIRADCRVIAATNRDLEDLMQRRLFREDLFYRLAVFPIELPPLRDRGSDVLKIAAHLIGRQSKALGRPITAIDETTRRILLAYAWPGNIRELENVVERACILAKGQVLTADTLPEGLARAAGIPPVVADIRGADAAAGAGSGPGSARPDPAGDVAARLDPGADAGAAIGDAAPPDERTMAQALRDLKVSMVRDALARTGGNQAQAARILGMQRSNLNRLIKELGL
jgi:transcriptional regulator with GAF, ATPase, and Fis domain/tetratricopeptide (TPR) repeat protein/tRNA A-37 threonylcarbamoyl transferase component Bud32